MIITRTPYRLSLFGGGTDYKEWFQEYGGLIIGSSFNKYCWITLRKLPPFFDHKSRIVYSKIESVKSNRDIQHPGVQSCLTHLQIDDPLEIHHDGDLPARSGIGSSSSFTVGLLNALYAHQSKMIGKRELAELAIHVEHNVAKEEVGIQDQILVSYGGMQVIEMGPGYSFTVSPLILPKEYRNQIQSHILLGFTGAQRSSSEASTEQVNKIKNGANISQLHEIQAIAREGYSLLQKNADLAKIGTLFDATWRLKKTLTDSMSNETIDLLYQKALSLGAYGGRLLGAGNGGFMMFFAPPERHERIKQELQGIKVWIPFEFEDSGSQVILYKN